MLHVRLRLLFRHQARVRRIRPGPGRRLAHFGPEAAHLPTPDAGDSLCDLAHWSLNRLLVCNRFLGVMLLKRNIAVRVAH